THHVNLGHEVTNVGNRESEMVATLSVASTREKTLVLSRQFSDQLFLRCHLRTTTLHHQCGYRHLAQINMLDLAQKRLLQLRLQGRHAAALRGFQSMPEAKLGVVDQPNARGQK